MFCWCKIYEKLVICTPPYNYDVTFIMRLILGTKSWRNFVRIKSKPFKVMKNISRSYWILKKGVLLVTNLSDGTENSERMELRILQRWKESQMILCLPYKKGS